MVASLSGSLPQIIFAFLCFVATASSYLNNPEVVIALKWNLAQDAHPKLPCKPDTTTEKWTNYKEEPGFRCEGVGNGSLNVLVIGNSMAWRAFATIEKIFQGKYKTIRMYARSSRPPLSDIDPVFTAATHIVVDRFRLDILWNLHGDGERSQFVGPFVDKKTDPMFLTFQKNTDYYRSKVFIIELPYFWEMKGVAKEFRRRLQSGEPLDNLKIAKTDTVAQQLHHKNRILALNCNNCVMNDVQSGIYEGDWYYLYNRKNLHGYTLDGYHFTSEMMEKLTPLYRQAAERAFSLVEG